MCTRGWFDEGTQSCELLYPHDNAACFFGGPQSPRYFDIGAQKCIEIDERAFEDYHATVAKSKGMRALLVDTHTERLNSAAITDITRLLKDLGHATTTDTLRWGFIRCGLCYTASTQCREQKKAERDYSTLHVRIIAE
ncbi:MAG: hypothetical protein FJY85_11050, partial [Deltaproteobacteria bacterium]|nr:hypothetical protein [Deltaproteobacteria bacterium]